MKLLELFSNGAPDIAADSTSMDDAQLLRNAIRKRKKNVKWITRTLSKKNNRSADDEGPDFVGDGEGNDADATDMFSGLTG